MNEELKNKLKPFFWVEHDNSVSLCHSVSGFKDEIFESRVDDGFEGNGYDWGSLAQVFLDEVVPEIKKKSALTPKAACFAPIPKMQTLCKNSPWAFAPCAMTTRKCSTCFQEPNWTSMRGFSDLRSLTSCFF